MPHAIVRLTLGFVLSVAAQISAADRTSLDSTFHELEARVRHTNASGKLEISVSKPLIISSRITHPELGAHEQPHLFKRPCGDIHLVFHSDGDTHGATRVVLRSSDKGQTWQSMPIGVNRHEAVGVLRNGTVLVYDDYAFRKQGNVFAGQMCVSRDGGRTFGPVELALFHRPNNVATACAGTYWNAKDLDKYRSTSARWSDQLCHALWRSVLEKPDGTLIACAHTSYQGDAKGRARVVCYHSTDGGRTWGGESTVAYDPAVDGEGFVEPVMSFCFNGDVLCMMRHGLWQARSRAGIYLGDTAFARSKGVNVQAFPDWRYVYKVVGRDVIIAGRDQPCPIAQVPNRQPIAWTGLPRLGTMKAATEFLRLYVGTRFLYPGQTGIEFLPRRAVAVPADLDVLKVPTVQFNFTYWGQNGFYEMANNFLSSVDVNIGGHTWPEAMPAETHRQTHPEYFALIGGKRCCTSKDYRGKWTEQYCISGPLKVKDAAAITIQGAKGLGELVF